MPGKRNAPKDLRRSRWTRRLLASQRGSLMLEAVVALAIFVPLGTALAAGIQTGYMAKRHFEVQSLSENIVRNQMEYAFEQEYVPPPATYPTITPLPGYSVTAEALVYDASSPNIEMIRVTVFRGGEQVKVIETLRANR
ncbi:MAG: hypothetical protein HY672_04905 [Chloroflexi bacterium]|nr:hypothetical protein [Chloroflexota bacterium]